MAQRKSSFMQKKRDSYRVSLYLPQSNFSHVPFDLKLEKKDKIFSNKVAMSLFSLTALSKSSPQGKKKNANNSFDPKSNTCLFYVTHKILHYLPPSILRNK